MLESFLSARHPALLMAATLLAVTATCVLVAGGTALWLAPELVTAFTRA